MSKLEWYQVRFMTEDEYVYKHVQAFDYDQARQLAEEKMLLEYSKLDFIPEHCRKIDASEISKSQSVDNPTCSQSEK